MENEQNCNIRYKNSSGTFALQEILFLFCMWGTEKEQAQETSHGTVCARVLDYFTSDYELYNIQILKIEGIQTKSQWAKYCI